MVNEGNGRPVAQQKLKEEDIVVWRKKETQGGGQRQQMNQLVRPLLFCGALVVVICTQVYAMVSEDKNKAKCG